MDEEDDIPYDDYEEEGIHVFAQGGGGESCDMDPNEEDVSPNDVGPLKPTFNQSKSQPLSVPGNDVLLQLPSPSRPGSSNIVKQQMVVDSGTLSVLRELHNERAKLLNDIEEEGKQRKWYFEQIEAIKMKKDSLPVSEKHSRQIEMARRQLEFEIKRVKDSFEQNMGTNDQIVQRQEARLQRIQVVETEILKLQQQHRRQMEVSAHREHVQEARHHQVEQLKVVSGHGQNDLTTDGDVNDDPNNITIATQTSVDNEDPNVTGIDPNASFSLGALYHGAWMMSPMKKGDLGGENRAENAGKSHDLASVMSFNSTNSSTQSSAAPSPPTHSGATQQHTQAQPGQSHDNNSANQQPPQQLGTKVEMVYSLLSMLGTHDKDDMSRTLLAMSSSQDSCIAMRQSGCMPLLIQLLHGSDKDSGLLGNTRGSKAARARAAAALHNIVHSHPDDKRGRREARVLRLLEQIRAHTDQLRETPSEEEEEGRQSKSGSRTHEMDHHPGPAVAALMKLSFDEEHRHAICSLGGVQAIAELIQVDNDVHNSTEEQYNITMRRYGCMGLTNLTFGDGTNKALLCSMKGFMEALVAQLMSTCEDLCQVAASVLRNLSWKADLASKKTLREVGAATMLMKAAMLVKKEATLKSILSALWNLSAHGSENKADICAVEGALEFLVSTLTYKSQSKTLAVIENGGGVLRNISSHITVREDYRVVLRQHGCLQILLKQLRSPSLTIVSNACGTLWNLSARCPEDQQALWDMGAVAMLKNLVHSKHQMISMGSSAALKNLLNACPSIKNMNMDKKQNSNRPSLHVRKQRALESEIDQNLSETCENLESPRDSPTDTNRTEKDHSRFAFPGNVAHQNTQHQQHNVQENTDPRRPVSRGHHYYQQGGNSSGENTPLSDSRLLSPKRVARSGSQDSVGSTHSDISHDRSRFRQAIKSAKQYHERDRQGGSLDRKSSIPRYNAATSSDENGSEHGSSHSNPGPSSSSRIAQVMKEVMNHSASSDRNSQSPVRGNIAAQQHGMTQPNTDATFSLPHAMLYRSYPNMAPSMSGQNPPMSQNAEFVSSAPSNYNPSYVIPSANNTKYKMTSHHVAVDNNDQPIDYSLKYHDNTSAVQAKKSLQPSSHPPQPKYGNFVGPNNTVPYNTQRGMPMQNKHPLGVPNPRGPHPFVGPALCQGLNQRVPPPQFSEYAETDLDSDDQPTDFSRKYAEQHYDNYTEQQYNGRYEDSDPNCADCKLEEARRTNERLEQYSSGFNDDQVTMFYTEGTPLNYMSLATSMTDLHAKTDKDENEAHKSKQDGEETEEDEEEVHGDKNYCRKHLSAAEKRIRAGSPSCNNSEQHNGSDSLSMDRQTGSTVISQYVANEQNKKVVISEEPMHRSFHVETEDDPSEDQIKTYCEEGTPICFSRVSSLSSLHSTEAQDKAHLGQGGIQNGLNRINEQSGVKTPPMKNNGKYTPVGRQKLWSDSDTPGSDIMEKEHKTVTFDDHHQVEETPLMFSRSSSLGSLSSFDAHSVHSSVVSEYSRRASEVVSPSELPDSPSQSMPSSPGRSKSPQRDGNQSSISTLSTKLSDDDVSNNDELQDFTKTPVKNILKPEPTMDILRTPVNQVLGQIGSIICKDDRPTVFADEGTPPNISDTHSMLSALTIDSINSKSKDNDVTIVQDLSIVREKEVDSSILNSDDKENSSMSEVSEGEEDILKACISSAMPRKMKRSTSDNAIKKKSNTSKSEQHKSRMPVRQSDAPATVNRGILSPKSNKTLDSSLHQQIMEENSGMNEDTVKSYAAEDFPATNSRTQPSKNSFKPVYDQPPQTSGRPQATATKIPSPKHSAINRGITTRMAAHRPSPLHKLQQVLRGGDVDSVDMGDCVTSYATEDTPLTQSAAVSPTSKKAPGFNMAAISKMDVPIPEDSVKSYAMEGTPYNASASGSPTHQPKTLIPPTVPPAQTRPPQTEPQPQQAFYQPKSNVPMTNFMSVPRLESNMDEDMPQTFATEDTPISFSRTDSLSDLSIQTNRTNESSPGMKSPIKTVPSSNIKTGNAESAESRENLPPPIIEENYLIDDTQSDNSSVLDESDELLSEIIQSAMPKGKVSRKLDMDRFAEGSESSKKSSHSSSFTANSEKPMVFQPQRTSSHVSSAQNQRDLAQVDKKIAVTDAMKTFAVEGTPLNFSTATSLSDITVESMDTPFFPRAPTSQNTTSKISQTFSSVTDQSNTSHTATFGTSADDSVFVKTTESVDSLRVYNVEGTPQTFSRNDSLSSLSVMDEDNKIEDISWFNNKPGKKTVENNVQNQSQNSRLTNNNKSNSVCHSDSELLREVEGQSSDETKSVSTKSEPLHSTIEEHPRTFAVEDTPLTFSRRSSLSSMQSQDESEQKKEEEKLAREAAAKDQGSKFKVEDTPVCFSRNSSLSSLSMDSDIFDDPTPSEQALLDECISSALPKSRSSKVEEKTNKTQAKPQRGSPNGSSYAKKDPQPKTTRHDRRSVDVDPRIPIEEARHLNRSFDASMSSSVRYQNRPGEFKVPSNYPSHSSSRRKSERRSVDSQMPTKSASRSYDRNLEKETSVYHYGYNQNRTYSGTNTDFRMTRSCSSAEDMNYHDNHHRSYAHESRISAWHQQQQQIQHQLRQQKQQQAIHQQMLEKPTTDMVKRGSWRRSRSQDSDGFLKRQKDYSNMEIAHQSVSTMPHRFRYSMETFSTSADSQQLQQVYVYQQQQQMTISPQKQSSISPPKPSYTDNKVMEERESRQRKSLWNRRSSTEKLSKRNSGSSIEKYDSEKSDRDSFSSQGYSSYETSQSRLRDVVYTQDETQTTMNKTFYASEIIRSEKEKSPFKYAGGIDNFGFDPLCNVDDQQDGDVTVVEQDSSVVYIDDNRTCETEHYEEGYDATDHDQSYEHNITPEDERALEIEAGMVVNEIQNRQMVGSAVEDDMFIENETLSLVSCDYTSDTASEVSLSWSNSEKMSDFSESTTLSHDDAQSNNGGGPRILKPGEKSRVTRNETENAKAVRGKRKPLYSPKSNITPPKTATPTNTKTTKPIGGANRSANTSTSSKQGPRKGTQTHPRASSTPTKTAPAASPKSKIGKPSPPERKSSTVLVSQRQTPTKNSPSRLPMSQTRKASTSNERPKPLVKQGTFTKEPTGVNAPKINDEEGGQNRWRRGGDASPRPSGSSQDSDSGEHNVSSSPEGNKENVCGKKGNVTSNLTKNRSNSGSNLAYGRPNSGKTPSKIGITKASSGSNLKKTSSGSSLTKTGSAASLNKSGTGLNKGGSNPNLKKLGSRGELRKSDSNASLKNNSRPSTPVGRKNSATPSTVKKADPKTNDNKKVGNAGKKQVNSKIAGLWRKDDNSGSQSSIESSSSKGSKLPVSTTPPKPQRTSSLNNSTSKLQQSKVRTASPSTRNNKSVSSQKSIEVPEGISRSSTYDKIVAINDTSQLPCLDGSDSEYSDAADVNSDNKSVNSGSSSNKEPPKKTDTVLVSPTSVSSDASNDSESVFKHPSRLQDPYGLKLLERKIDSSTWKKKKSDNYFADLPNADETSKSLEAVKALLDSSMLNESSIMNSSSMTHSSSMNCSVFEDSYISQGNNTIDSSWRRHRDPSFSSVGQSDDEDSESVWVRRDGDTSRSEPELSKHGLFRLSRRKTSKSRSESKSFLPIKAIKQVFTGNKPAKKDTKKAASSFSLNTSKESLHKINKIEAFEKEFLKKREKDEAMKKKEESIKKKREESLKKKEENARKKEEQARKKEEKKKEKDEKKAAKSMLNGSAKLSPTTDTTKTSPQALVPPFNYKPSPTKSPEKMADITIDTSVNESVTNDDSVFVKPNTPKKTGVPNPGPHATKTEMLLARRRISYLHSLGNKGEENNSSDSEGNTNKGCIVTTV